MRQIQDLPSAGFQSNGNYTFANSVSGSNLTDFLLGRPSAFNQSTPQSQRLEAFNVGFYLQDALPRVAAPDLEPRAALRAVPPVGGEAEPPDRGVARRRAVATLAGLAAQRPGRRRCGRARSRPREAVEPLGPAPGRSRGCCPTTRTSVRGGFGIFHEFPGSIVNNRITLAPPFAVAINIQNPTSLTSPWTATSPTRTRRPCHPARGIAFPEPVASTVYADGFTNANARHWNAIGRTAGDRDLARRACRTSGPAARPAGQPRDQRGRRSAPARRSGQHQPAAALFPELLLGGAVRVNRPIRLPGGCLQHGETPEPTATRSRRATRGRESEDNGGAVVAGGAGAFYTDPNDPDYDYSFSDFDRTHRFIGTFVWEMPGAGLPTPRPAPARQLAAVAASSRRSRARPSTCWPVPIDRSTGWATTGPTSGRSGASTSTAREPSRC